jgi:guanylate kinase
MSSRIPFLIVVSAPSGTGKTSLCREVAKKEDGMRYAVSCTTRPRRKDEVDGRDYKFLDPPTFEQWVEEEKFAEWAIYQGSQYGTLKEELECPLREGNDVIADVEIQGAMKLEALYPNGVFIYVLPPSKEELRRRLETRGSGTAKETENRLLIAEEELSYANKYGYIVVNKVFDTTVDSIVSIVRAERLKSNRLPDPSDIIKWAS